MSGQVLTGVYAIRAHGLPFVKIGYSKNARQRLREIQTGCPARVFLHAYLPGATEADEKEIHRKLHPWNTSGDWFSWADPVRAELNRFVKINKDAHTGACQQEAAMTLVYKGRIVELEEKLDQVTTALREINALLEQDRLDGAERHPWTAQKEMQKKLREVAYCNWKMFRREVFSDEPKQAVNKLFRFHESFAKDIARLAQEHFDGADLRWRKIKDQMFKAWEALE